MAAEKHVRGASRWEEEAALAALLASVGVDEVVGDGVLGEERQHAAGAPGPGGHVVLL
jgi:hypothetical protein